MTIKTSEIKTIGLCQMPPQNNNNAWRVSLITAFCDDSHASPFIFHHNPPPTEPLMQRVVEAFSIFTSKSIYILFFSIQAYALILFLFIPLHVLICATLHRCYIFLIPLRSFSFFSMWIFRSPSRPLQSKARVTNSSLVCGDRRKVLF